MVRHRVQAGKIHLGREPGRAAARRTFTVYGFSKGYGLAGMRLGLVIAPNTAEHGALVSGSHADETAYGVSTLSQVAGIAAFERGDEWLGRFVAHLRRQRDHAVARLNRIAGVSCHVPDATFVVFPMCRRSGSASSRSS